MKKLTRLLWMLILALPLAANGLPVFAQGFSAHDVIAAVNALRAARGLAPYEVDGGLMAFAQQHSEYQARIGTSTHTHSDGQSPSAYGVTENIAAGGASTITLDWMIYTIWADALHMNTMVGYESGFAGAGIARSGDTVYVTLDVRPGASAALKSPSNSTPGAGSASSTQIALVPLITATPNANGAIVHLVGYGQSLWSIAIAYGVKIDQIRTLNGLAPGSTDIYSGQKLVIRQAGAAATPESGTPAPADASPPPPDEALPTNPPTYTAPPSPTFVPTASATLAPTAKPIPQLSKTLPRRLLAVLLILIGVGGAAWVIVGGFRRQD